ncbi:hypothetical protein V5799_024517 [Amblyomma americanum]|uniref:Piwi domain-containing protein n=1 Tax=Amblyomma americanum TaxID=6943 RepID=A0AAQ4EBU7_AMBAM
MVIGYDTYPDSSSRNRSAGAFVASMNKSLTRWYSRVFFHATHKGLANSPPSLLRDALRKYSQCNDGASPDRIIFFRDGVSDGQIPQSVRQGTVAPTHYNVIYDTTGLKPDHMERLAYKLTHLYFNWPGTIRVPAPCQYAHKLAFLAGQSLHAEHDPRLSSTLFYL